MPCLPASLPSLFSTPGGETGPGEIPVASPAVERRAFEQVVQGVFVGIPRAEDRLAGLVKQLFPLHVVHGQVYARFYSNGRGTQAGGVGFVLHGKPAVAFVVHPGVAFGGGVGVGAGVARFLV